jgi:hypothetical protein
LFWHPFTRQGFSIPLGLLHILGWALWNDCSHLGFSLAFPTLVCAGSIPHRCLVAKHPQPHFYVLDELLHHQGRDAGCQHHLLARGLDFVAWRRCFGHGIFRAEVGGPGPQGVSRITPSNRVSGRDLFPGLLHQRLKWVFVGCVMNASHSRSMLD